MLSIVNCSKYRFQSALEIGQTKPRSPRVYWREKRGNSLRLSRAKLPPVLYCCTTAHPMKSFDPSKISHQSTTTSHRLPTFWICPQQICPLLSTQQTSPPSQQKFEHKSSGRPWTGNGTSPPLLKALRSTPFYYEALEVFYKCNTFVLGRKNQWSFLDMPESVVRTITRLQLDITWVVVELAGHKHSLTWTSSKNG